MVNVYFRNFLFLTFFFTKTTMEETPSTSMQQEESVDKPEDEFVKPKTKSRKRKQPDMDTTDMDISNPSSKRPHFKPLKAVASSVNILFHFFF